MNKEEKEKIEIDDKEEKALGKWMPLGVMIGTTIGSILSMTSGNIMFLGGGSVVGLLLGTIIGSIANEKNEDKNEK